MSNKQPANAEPITPSGLPQPSPAEWERAAKACAAGDAKPMTALLISIDLPLRLFDLFAAVLSDLEECEKEIAAYKPGEYEANESELAALRMLRTDNMKEAKAAHARITELESQRGSAMNRREQAKQAEAQIASMHAYFPELFGLPKPERFGSVNFRNPTMSRFRELGLNPDVDSWRDCLRAPEQKQKRPIRASGFNAITNSRG